MKMNYDEEEKCNYNEKKFNFIPYVITKISNYSITSFAPFSMLIFLKTK
jgi:hypothetical protein